MTCTNATPRSSRQAPAVAPPSPVDEDDRLGGYLEQQHAAETSTDNGNGNGNVNRQATIRQTSAERVQEAKRKMLLKDLEGEDPRGHPRVRRRHGREA